MDENKHFLTSLPTILGLKIRANIEYIREHFIVPNQQKYPWYHQKFQRVPTIDECGELDIVCRLEAQMQFERDKMVDDEIVHITRQRYQQCSWCYGADSNKYCSDYRKVYENTAAAWFIKYGDMAYPINVVEAFMKQKHRMIWERRHGPVGSGITNKKYAI
ncbi:NADH dehydrogenase [ubiquinone] 1 beta subcomplex subunit 10 [Eufriesea mexicana]|uniref:NADH dehydrogenase [ubiquinone] 1 beta subcomplex subunit 10 n=1 Tax=Eufriesea mexicana TaxID=516756 RepID=A0A310S8V8_9HYME|nr:PREDICTED: NADH dehydrogenase [ubiquinone] 1 beta subcomplex subunit 10 [Eufriesea mexicana]OAD54920.1 NADH dehydrogenase [ubiquinone] 1 beta subcomplex subunit 10 [Eufriesea mexicana]